MLSIGTSVLQYADMFLASILQIFLIQTHWTFELFPLFGCDESPCCVCLCISFCVGVCLLPLGTWTPRSGIAVLRGHHAHRFEDPPGCLRKWLSHVTSHHVCVCVLPSSRPRQHLCACLHSHPSGVNRNMLSFDLHFLDDSCLASFICLFSICISSLGNVYSHSVPLFSYVMCLYIVVF